jgi:hypothetical protein
VPLDPAGSAKAPKVGAKEQEELLGALGGMRGDIVTAK